MIVKHILSADAGELSPWLDARTDIAKYAAGCRLLRNFVVTPQGAVTKRPGMEFRGSLTAGAASGRLVEFQISSTNAAILALGGDEMRIWLNGTMLMTADAVPLPYALAIPWADADLPLLRWKQINDVMYFVHPEHAPHKLTHIANDSWTLAPVDFGANHPLLPENIVPEWTITSAFSTSASAWAAATAYVVGDRRSSGGVTYSCNIAHKSNAAFSAMVPAWSASTAYAVGAFAVIGALVYECNFAHTSAGTVNAAYWTYRANYSSAWRLWTEVFADTSSDIGQAVTLTATRDTWVAAHVGAVFELATMRAATAYETTLAATAANTGAKSSTLVVQGGWKFETFGTWYGNFVVSRSLDRGATWETLRTFIQSATVPRNVSVEGSEDTRALLRMQWTSTAADAAGSAPYGLLSVTETKVRGLVRITGVTNARSAAAVTLSVIEGGTTPFWSEGAWSDFQGWPRCLEIHQARLLLAATTLRPHSIWGSAIDDYPNFKLGTDADAAFFHTIMAGERDPILWLVAEKYLLIGTGAGEFVMHGESEDAAITPEFATARRQSSFGSHAGGVSAIFSDSIALFLQRGGTRIREFFYDMQSDRYQSANLNIMADHIFDNLPVEDSAVARMPFAVIWFVCAGKFYGLTYERNQNVVAWHRHETAGTVQSVATIRTAGAEDEVWFLVDRGGDLQVERFHPGALTNPQDDGWWSDAAASLASPYDLADVPHLEGAAIHGFSGGDFYGPAILTGTTWPFTTGMLVEGFASVTDAATGISRNPNGRYRVAGERNGKPWFSLAYRSDPEEFCIQWVIVDGVGGWIFAMNYDTEFVSTDAAATPEGVSTWTPVGNDEAGTITAVSETPGEAPPVLVGSGVAADGAAGYYQPIGGDVWSKASYVGGDGLTVPEYRIRLNSELSRWEAGPVALATYRAAASAATPADVVTWNNALTGVATALVIAAETVATPPVILGLRYDAAFYPMKPELQLANGSSRSRELRIHRIAPSLYKSRSGKFGVVPTGELLPLNAGSSAAVFTGEIEKAFPGPFSEDGNFCIVSDEPVPFAIRSVCIKFNAYGDSN